MANRFVLNETSYHGKGAIKEIVNEIKARGFGKVLVCVDPDLIKFGVAAKVTDLLDQAKIVYEIFSQVKANPTVANVQAGVAAFKASKADAIVAIGGGSPIDAAKAMWIKYEYPEIHITSGLSNISFGLPERLFVNSSFMALAIGQGLTMAIANPSQDLLMHAVFAADLLMNKPDADLRYINRVSEHKISVVSGEVDAVQTTTKKSGSGSKDLIPPEHEGDKIFEAVVKGRKNKIETLVQDALQGGIDAQKVIDESLIPAINHVGVLFDKQIYFLPQLISSAETMETGIGVVEPILAANRSSEPLGTIVIATVEHDIHDIGKNLVALMLRNYGYRVVDLGKDVPAEDIIQAAIREKADIIGLSALMTTTMMEMKKVVNMVREQNLPVKVMIGGAVITRSFADEIGAEGYSKDAQEAVVEVARLLGR